MSFYDEGLRFSCIQCGACCRISGGYVWLSPEDLSTLVARFGLPADDFRDIYTEVVDKAVALKSFPNGDCIFYDGEIGCKVYDSRPLQCRTFPFWPENVKNGLSWDEAAESCPGVGTGELHGREEIERYLDLMRRPYEH